MKLRRYIIVILALLWVPMSHATTDQDIYTRLEHAQALSNDGKFVEAGHLFDSLVKSVDHNDHQALAWAYFGRSYTAHQLSENGEADRDHLNNIVYGYRKAWTLDSAIYLAAASFNAGLILHRLGNTREALDAFLLSTTVSHNMQAIAYFNAAREYEALQMPHEAERSYQQSIDIDPGNNEAREALLELYSSQAWDDSLIKTAQKWSTEQWNLQFINFKLNELLQRTKSPASDEIADKALVLMANNHAIMGLTYANFIRLAQTEYERAAAVHPKLLIPVKEIAFAYKVRQPGATFVESADSSWWWQTHERHRVWSNLLKSLGDQNWLAKDYKLAASYYEAAIGYRVPYQVKRWVNLDALGMLVVSKYYATQDTNQIPTLIHAVDSWLADGMLHTKKQREMIRDFYFLAGWAYTVTVNYNRAIELYNKSLKLDPNNADIYVNLGYIYMGSLKLPEAINYFEHAVELDPQNSMALNNLGFANLIYGDFSKSIDYLERAHQKEKFLLNTINLGDAYRYAGNVARALELHLEALDGVTKRYTDEDNVGSNWRYNYMPLHVGDTQTIQESILVRHLDEKRAFVHYALSFDYALLDDIATAQREFVSATGFAYNRDYRCFFANKIAAIQVFVNASNTSASWLDEKRLELRHGLDCIGS